MVCVTGVDLWSSASVSAINGAASQIRDANDLEYRMRVALLEARRAWWPRDAGEAAATRAWHTNILSLASLGLVVVLVAGLSRAVARGITRPIRLLTVAMTRLADGDWSTEVPGVAREDELGE